MIGMQMQHPTFINVHQLSIVDIGGLFWRASSVYFFVLFWIILTPLLLRFSFGHRDLFNPRILYDFFEISLAFFSACRLSSIKPLHAHCQRDTPASSRSVPMGLLHLVDAGTDTLSATSSHHTEQTHLLTMQNLAQLCYIFQHCHILRFSPAFFNTGDVWKCDDA